MAKKRYRSPKPKPGELIAQWGKLPHCYPDLCYFRGEGIPKCDMHLVHNTLTGKVCRFNYDGPRQAPLDYVKYEPGFLEELDKRGYDVTTLRLYVRKKEQ